MMRLPPARRWFPFHRSKSTKPISLFYIILSIYVWLLLLLLPKSNTYTDTQIRKVNMFIINLAVHVCECVCVFGCKFNQHVCLFVRYYCYYYLYSQWPAAHEHRSERRNKRFGAFFSLCFLTFRARRDAQYK